MNNDYDESLWERLASALFGARRTTDEGAFTSRVMAQIYEHQPAKRTWPAFLRWAAPTLALSMASFTIAIAYSLTPDTVSAETLLLEDQEPEVSEAWLATPAENNHSTTPEVNP